LPSDVAVRANAAAWSTCFRIAALLYWKSDTVQARASRT
jgi:hypothetical protein